MPMPISRFIYIDHGLNRLVCHARRDESSFSCDMSKKCVMRLRTVSVTFSGQPAKKAYNYSRTVWWGDLAIVENLAVA